MADKRPDSFFPMKLQTTWLEFPPRRILRLAREKQNSSQKRAIWGSQKRKSLLSSNATIYSSFFRARAIYTHTRTVLSRSSTTLSRIHTRYKRETTKTAKREGGRGVLFLWWFCASQRVKESAFVCYFSRRVRRSRGGNLVKR